MRCVMYGVETIGIFQPFNMFYSNVGVGEWITLRYFYFMCF